jgi:hypothetical protein
MIRALGRQGHAAVHAATTGTDRYPAVAPAAAKLRAKSFTIDGEAVGGRRLLTRAPAGIVFNEHTDEDGAVVFRHACKLRLEGIVSKRLADRGPGTMARDFSKDFVALFPIGFARHRKWPICVLP